MVETALAVLRMSVIYGILDLGDPEPVARRGRQLAEEIGDPESLADLCSMHGLVISSQGPAHFAEGQALVEQGLAIRSRRGDNKAEKNSYTHYLLRSRVTGDVKELLLTALRKEGCFRHPKVNYEIYVKQVQGRRLYGVQFLRHAADGRGVNMIPACQGADMHVDVDGMQLVLDLHQCEVVQSNGMVGYVAERVWPIDLPNDLGVPACGARPTDMTWSDLGLALQQLESEKERTAREIDDFRSAIHKASFPPISRPTSATSSTNEGSTIC